MADLWTPDSQLVAAVRTGRCGRTYQDLSPPDRAWVVAGLTIAGFTAETIAELLGCSLRTVRVVIAEPAHSVCVAFMTEIETFSQEMRLARSELDSLTVERDAAVATAARLRAHLDRVTASRDTKGVPLCAKRLHHMSGYNVYRDPAGRSWCRECSRQRQQDSRAKRRAVCATN